MQALLDLIMAVVQDFHSIVMASYIASMKPSKLLIDCSGIYRDLLFVSAFSLESYNAVNPGI